MTVTHRHLEAAPAAPPRAGWKPPRVALDFLRELGQVAELLGACFRAAQKRPVEWKAILTQCESVGIESLGIVFVTSTFIGMVMALQFGFGLQKFGGMEYLGRVVGITFAREIAPTFMAVIVGGRIAAGMSAELGAMTVTEQLDAIRALGADPVKKLVWPRLLACIVVMPVMSTFALILGFCGAMLVTDTQFGIPAAFFFSSALDQIEVMDYLMGLLKTPLFGALIALIGCHNGMRTVGGTAGVGRSTTRAVVTTVICVMIADYFLSKLVIDLWTLALAR